MTNVVAQTANHQPAGNRGGHSHAMGSHNGAKKLALMNAEGAVVTLWKPDLTKRELHPKMDMITIAPTGMDNYHAIVVKRDWPNAQDVLVRYEYLRGKPSGQSPTRLTSAVKASVEIVPDPIPREHHHYFAGDEAAFLVRYQNTVIPNQPVVLSTSYGSRIKATSDATGRVRFTIPDDFPNVIPGERDRRSAEMSVSTEYQVATMQYNSALSADYRMTSKHWQSKPWGVAIAGLGFVFGGVITRIGRRRKSGVAI